MKKIPKWIKVAPIVVLVIFGVVVFGRLQLAAAEVQQDLNMLKTTTPLDIGETTALEILPLYEGVASRPDLHSGLGVSYLIKTDTATILFDVGNNPESTSPSPLEQNMAKLGVSLDDVDVIVFSHTHYDHTGGQRWPGTFAIGGAEQVPLGDRPIFVPEALTYPGSDPLVVTAPRQIAEGVARTGAIPFVYSFPIGLAIPQGVEQALVINVKDRGIVVVTGCGHMIVDSLLAHVRAEFAAPVVGVIGGLHYGSADAAALQSEIQLVQGLNPAIVALSPHDSGPAALEAFARAFSTTYQPMRVGEPIQIQ